MMSRVILAAAALVYGFGSAHAQNSDAAKVVLENEQVRVIEMRFKPGMKLDTTSHPNRFIYGLSDGALLFSPPGRTPYELSFKAGEALWLPAQAMATQNEGDKEVRALVVELKDLRVKGNRAAPAKSAKAAGRGSPAKKSK